MGSHYQTLRIQPEKDILGKSEADILKKIEANYKALVARAPQMYPVADVREKALKEMEEAKSVLSDSAQRAAYDEQLKMVSVQAEKDKVEIVIIELTDDVVQQLRDEDEQADE